MVSITSWASTKFGSDVYTHYTAVYTWNSNQMAHAMMGFAGATLFIQAAQQLGFEFWYGALFYVIPFLKDMTDYFSDTCIVKPDVFKIRFSHKCESLLDAVTDNVFWLAGSVFAFFVALSCIESAWLVCISFITLLLFVSVCVFGLKPYFNGQKNRFDVSGLPYYFRLPLYWGKLAALSNADSSSDTPIKEIERFVYMDKSRARHLLLFGPPRSLKTTLATAIGSGLINRRQTVRYLSRARLMEEFGPDDDHGDRSPAEPIPPHMADIVIVDDFDQPDSLGEILPILKKKSTVWVITDRDGQDSQNSPERWVEILGEGLDGRLASIKLKKPDRIKGKQVSLWVGILAAVTLLVSLVSIVGAVVVLLFAPRQFDLVCFCCPELGIYQAY